MLGPQFQPFGDQRDNYSDVRKYTPEGSKRSFELRHEYGSVVARQIGKPDEILPGGRAVKRVSGILSTWPTDGGRWQDGGKREVLDAQVSPGFRRMGLAKAMLSMAHEKYPDLSHSTQLSAEGARFAHANPLPGDTEATKAAQAKHLIADAATTLLGGPRRTGF